MCYQSMPTCLADRESAQSGCLCMVTRHTRTIQSSLMSARCCLRNTTTLNAQKRKCYELKPPELEALRRIVKIVRWRAYVYESKLKRRK